MHKEDLSEEEYIISGECPPTLLDEVDTEIYSRFLKPTKRHALFILMMDVSGSMGIWEKYMVRSVWFWVSKVLERKYDIVSMKFIAHHTEARFVTMNDIFNRGEAGGTIASSALRMAWNYISEDNDFSDYDIYLIHGTDGDNLTSDNRRYIEMFEQLKSICKRIAIININQYDRRNTLGIAFNQHKELKQSSFFTIRMRSHIYDTLLNYFYPLASTITNIGHVRLLDKEY